MLEGSFTETGPFVAPANFFKILEPFLVASNPNEDHQQEDDSYGDHDADHLHVFPFVENEMCEQDDSK